ncbi:cell division protein FtsX [Gracilibacillus boraciitolerans JCM 21714]|uniref:Cell division protein FtsX n=1 Tax=Gracilibacillus boraciitolerans JCM 21714 TaxID=1298598 RepID=W4VPT8_9BACI|nr:cell division protein FtsX [Gracilibacillus boraciitolerans JCM 21714]
MKAWEIKARHGGLYEQDNPLNDAFVIKATDPLETETIANEIEQFDSVYRVNYGQEYVDSLFKFNEYARNIGLVLIIALVFTAIFLISNTIKITILARKKEIGIMKLVGATNNFIRWPFFVEGLLLGVLGSLLPIAVILVGYYFLTQNLGLMQQFDFVKILPFYPFAIQISALIIGIGATIGVWGKFNECPEVFKSLIGYEKCLRGGKYSEKILSNSYIFTFF